MDIQQLYARALCAGHAYYQIYGKYPEKIGVHPDDYTEFVQNHPIVFFLEEMPITPHLFTEQEDITLPRPWNNIHRTIVDPIAGRKIRSGEVYFPVPGNPLHARTSGDMIEMAQRLQQTLDTEYREALQGLSFTPQQQKPQESVQEHGQYL